MITENHFTSIDWLVLVAYFLGTMGIGFYFYRRSRSMEGFTTANRSMPGWACGLSIFATYLSSISFLALPGKSFASNWNPFVFSLSIPLATWVAVYFFLPYYRRSGEISAYALLENRFGPWARVYASFFYILTQLARMGVVMYLMALPLSFLLHVDIRLIIFFTGISVTLYSFVGGIVAVIWTDVLQAIILIAGAAACSLLMLLQMPEGPAQLFDIAAAHDKFSLGSFEPTLSESTFWVVFVYGLIINLQNFGIDQSYIQRYIASKSNREARKSVWLGGLLYVPVSALFFFLGTQLFAFYQVNPDELQEVRLTVASQQVRQAGTASDDPAFAGRVQEHAAALTLADIGDKVFPHFIGKHLPIGITGLLIAAIFAAAMSTVSTSLNSSATLLTRDWYQRFFRKTATEQQSLRALYTATVLWGLLGTGVAFLLVNISSALDAWWTLSGIFGGGMLGLFLLGMISKRAGNPAAVTAVLLGLLIITWMTLSRHAETLPVYLVSHFHAFLIPVFGTLSILLTGLLIAQFSKRNIPKDLESKCTNN